MNRLIPILAIAVVALVAGCQSKPKSAAVATAAAPHKIDELTNQTVVYECPQCGMDYDAPGQCPMDHIDLVKTAIAYICPADHQPVEHSGKCPRCQANATIQRTALQPPVPKALTGN